MTASIKFFLNQDLLTTYTVTDLLTPAELHELAADLFFRVFTDATSFEVTYRATR